MADRGVHRWLCLALIAAPALGCTRANPAFQAVVGLDAMTLDGRGDSVPAPPDAPDAPLADAGDGPIVPDGPGERAGDDAPSPDRPAPDAPAPDVTSVEGGAGDAGDASAEVAPGPRPSLTIVQSLGTAQYGGDGGAASSVTCGTGEVLIGYLGNTGTTGSGVPVVSRLEARCARLAVTATAPYQITVTPTGALRSVGGGTANPFMAVCPAPLVLIGIHGREGSSMDQMGFRCAPLTIESGPPARVVVGAVTNLGPYPPSSTGGDPFGESCKPGEAALGHFVNAGSWIDGIGLHCGALRLGP